MPMTPPSATRFSGAKKAWDEYGHVIPWDKLIDFKFQEYSTGGAYLAVAWRPYKDLDEICYADLEEVNGVWEVNNDGSARIPSKDWEAARCVRECNWLKFPKAQQHA